MPQTAPAPQFLRNANQRAAFGRFCVGATTFLSPGKIEQRTTGQLRISSFRRSFLGIDLPIVYALIEKTTPGSEIDARQVVEAFAGERADIIRVYLAGLSTAGRHDRHNSGKYHDVYFPLRQLEAIELTDSYERFLRTLGNHTRRDMRRSRRQAASLGLTFTLEPMSQNGATERHALGKVNRPKPYPAGQIDIADRFLAAQETGFHAQLRSASGELLSCCAGFISDGSAIILYQLNDRNYPDLSLSLTHRSFIIEHLIEHGIQEFLLPGGAAGLLEAACRPREGGELLLIRRSATAMAKAGLIAAARPTSRVGMAFRKIVGTHLTACLRTQPRTFSP